MELNIDKRKNALKRANNNRTESKISTAHNHAAELKRLSRIKGQVEGVERMIHNRRYCPDIVTQIKAIRSALRSLEVSIIEGHMKHCVNAAIKSRDSKVVQEKLDEILMLMKGQS